MRKALHPIDATSLEHIPNVGPAIAEDFKLLGIKTPEQLKRKDPLKLYQQLCKKTGVRHDPCVLDTFMAAIYFMDGKGKKDWWDFTELRKRKYSLE